tara:strand:+ start:681 stop:2012 length:1332 start_codon:yes stop_codon:yes gene_type:complete
LKIIQDVYRSKSPLNELLPNGCKSKLELELQIELIIKKIYYLFRNVKQKYLSIKTDSSKNKSRFIKLEKSLLIVGTILVLLSFFKSWPHYLWDLFVYQNAINIFNSGGSAYSDLEGLRFVYAPYILILFSLLGTNLSLFLVLFYISSSLAILRQRLSLQLILYSIISSFLFFNNFFAKSIATGNLTIFLHFSIISAANIRSKKFKELFLLTVAISSLIKPYLFAYVFLGFAIWPNKKNYIKGIAITAIFVVLFSVSQLFFTPDLFSGFTESLFAQAIGDVDGPGRDVGLAPYWVFGNFLDRQYALALHFILVILLGKSFINLGKLIDKFINKDDAMKLILFISLLCITFINPRMKVYDYWIVLGSSAGIICTLFRQPKFLSIEFKIYSLILTGLVFMFVPVIYKIYIPPSLSYFLSFYYYKYNKFPDDYSKKNYDMTTLCRKI